MKFAKIYILLAAVLFYCANVAAAANPNVVTVLYRAKIPVIATVNLKDPAYKDFQLEPDNIVVFFDAADKIGNWEKFFKVKLQPQSLDTLSEDELDFIKFHVSENYKRIGIDADAPFTIYQVLK